ncbi:hypothetical protein MKEN_01188600 [Mycena kentingensis (nom. inval.)]|nr:hypothetical protein MKEN_01188600 [Mycena kentingensis (nom. inval.)]
MLALTRLATALATPLVTPLLQAAKEKKTHTHPELWSPEFWEKMTMSAVLVLLGGVFAGFVSSETMQRERDVNDPEGLMGLDELHLRVLSTSSEDPNEQSNAKKVLRLLENKRHWVLVVLLLGNVIINESLPIFLDSAIGGGFAAVAISTAAIVIFGEIIPQALSVRYGLAIGAVCAPFVLGKATFGTVALADNPALMYIFSPVAYPIAKLLDWMLGEGETHTYKKAELKSFLAFHRTGEQPLRDDEISILNGVLELNDKSVEDIMTPMKDVVTLSADAVLDEKLVERILLSGYSRFPVHEPGNPDAFVGLLLIKKLLRYDPSLALPVSGFPLSILPEAPPTISCFQALDYLYVSCFGRSSDTNTRVAKLDALICYLYQSHPERSVEQSEWYITLEGLFVSVQQPKLIRLDIIEEILSEEIVDETDRYLSNTSKHRASRLATAAVMKGYVNATQIA